jgi:CheY-like chemotaxis protein
VDLHADEVASKGLSLTCEVDPQVPRVVRGDALRLTQVLLNLVGNAVKFTDEGAVEVGVHLDSRVENDVDLRVVIADSGPGIEADLRRRLFEPFTQADDSMSRRHGGLGLGLSICKEIVERMGGTIQVESARPRGCVAWFSVRLEVGDAVAPDSAVPVEPALPAIPVAPTADPREDPEPRASSLCGVHALLVEDNTVNQMVARGVLERAGCVVHVAGNGQEAVDAVGAATFDIILMDCQMPVMDGYEATAEIRRLEANDRRVPIIAVTAHALPEERARCLDVGMDDFVSKPFRPSELIATIERALGDSAVAA